MATKPLQISWNNLTGGINDQIWQGQPGRYYRGYGFDTLRFDTRPLRRLRLDKTYTENVNAIFSLNKLNNSGYEIIWGNDGKIYESNSLTPVSTIRGTAKQGYNIGYMKPTGSSDYKLYYFHYTIPTDGMGGATTKYIHRTNISGGGLDENYRSYVYGGGNTYLVPPVQPGGMIIKNEGNRILFSYYNTIWEIDNAEVVTKLIEFPNEQNVVGITEFQGSYKVYTTSGFATSKIYAWDGLASLPELSIDLQGIAITGGVQNLGAYDYFIGDGSLYKVAGVQYQKIYNLINGRLIGSYDNRLVLELRTPDNYLYIAELDSVPGYSLGIHPRYIIDIANQTGGEVKSIDYNTDGLIIGSDKKLLRNTGVYNQDGTINYYLESLTFVGDSIQFRKSIDKIILKFSGLTTQNIQLYVDVDNKVFLQRNPALWIKLWEGNNESIGTDNMGLEISSQSFLNPIGKFNTIRFKIVIPFSATSASSTSPQGRFYGLDVFGNQDVGL